MDESEAERESHLGRNKGAKSSTPPCYGAEQRLWLCLSSPAPCFATVNALSIQPVFSSVFLMLNVMLREHTEGLSCLYRETQREMVVKAVIELKKQ